jgi:hypothetical protein
MGYRSARAMGVARWGGDAALSAGMKLKRRRKCRCCGDLYMPERRNAYHQKHCCKAGCQAASRRCSQARWLAKPENRDYHGKSGQVARVQAWRREHPGYWRRKAVALQDFFPAQPADAVALTSGLTAPWVPASGVPTSALGTAQHSGEQQVASLSAVAEPAADVAPLQDLFPSQDPVVVGLISILTGALQDDMAGMIARLQTRGRAILRNGPGLAAKGD